MLEIQFGRAPENPILKPPSYHETLPGNVQVLRWPSPSRWSNGPGDVYAAHAHPYRKTLFCLEGSIVFSLPDSGREVELHPGDRLIIPAGTRHGAIVGPRGVACIEAGGN